MTIGTSCWFIFKHDDFFYLDDYQIYKPWLFLTGLDFVDTNLGPSFFSITWSLSVEIQLYFLIFFLTFMSKNINIIVSIILVVLGMIIPFFYSNHFGLIMHLDEFFAGVLMRYYYDKNKFLSINRFHLDKIWILFIMLLVIDFSKFNTDIGNPLFDFALLVSITSLFLFLHNNSFKNKVVQEIGRNCYFIYLYHMIVYYILNIILSFILGNFINNLLITFASFASCFVLSIFSMKYFEIKTKEAINKLKFDENYC